MEALWMPKGSVRAMLILLFGGTVCYLCITKSPIPEDLWDIIHIGVAFYFGMKVAQNKEVK